MTMMIDKSRVGRPLALPPSYAELGERIRLMFGATDREVAAVFGVDLATWRRMRRRAALAARENAQKMPCSVPPAPALQRLARDLRRISARLQTAVQ